MDDVNELRDEQPGAELPTEPAAPITSRFLYVDVAALRAKQLRRGAQPRISDSDGTVMPHKAERVAMEEVRQGKVHYDIVVPKVGQGEA
jgi:DNA-directed RNA polymerase subunit K/omega